MKIQLLFNIYCHDCRDRTPQITWFTNNPITGLVNGFVCCVCINCGYKNFRDAYTVKDKSCQQLNQQLAKFIIEIINENFSA